MDEDTAIGFGDDFATMGLLPSTISGTFLLTNYRIMFLAYDGFLHKASTSLRRAVGVVDLPHMAVGQLTVTTAEPTTISVKTKTFRTVAIKFGESRNGTWVSQVKALMDMQVFPRSLTPHNLDEIFAFNPEHREGVHAALLASPLAPAADADSDPSGSLREGGGGASSGRGAGGVLGSVTKASETKAEESIEGKDGWLLYDAEQEFIRQVRSCDHKLDYHPCVRVCSSTCVFAISAYVGMITPCFQIPPSVQLFALTVPVLFHCCLYLCREFSTWTVETIDDSRRPCGVFIRPQSRRRIDSAQHTLPQS
jgi:hypothetical protein